MASDVPTSFLNEGTIPINPLCVFLYCFIPIGSTHREGGAAFVCSLCSVNIEHQKRSSQNPVQLRTALCFGEQLSSIKAIRWAISEDLFSTSPRRMNPPWTSSEGYSYEYSLIISRRFDSERRVRTS